MAILTAWCKGEPVEVLVDDEDLEWLNQFRWYLTPDGYIQRNLLRSLGEPRGTIRLHRQIMGCTTGDGRVADHLNGEPLDNRRQNLAIGTQGDNMQNVRSHRDSLYSAARGVSYNKGRDRWLARHMHKGKSWTRRFRTEEEAIAAARARRAEVLGRDAA